MEVTSLGIAVAFTAGLLSFLSPCVLPLVPSYVTFITGLSLEDASRARRASFVHALLFVVGFSLIFLALGASATALGRLLFAQRVWISRIGGALVVLFGFYLLGAFDSAFLARERRVHFADKPVGYLGTLLVGVALGAGWTPCIGAILGAILALTASTADLRQGLLLLGAYSLGLAIPFLVSALAVERFLSTFRRLRPHMGVVTRASGALLIGVGALMMTSYFTRLAGYLQALTPDVIRTRI
jgi:cytochrome c-type biogenesis protein